MRMTRFSGGARLRNALAAFALALASAPASARADDALTIEIDAGAVPLLEGALALATAGMLTSADKTNREYVGADVAIDGSVDENVVKLLFDPQTAGGMLISIPQGDAESLLGRLRDNYPNARIIGRVHPRGPHSIIVSSVDNRSI